MYVTEWIESFYFKRLYYFFPLHLIFSEPKRDGNFIIAEYHSQLYCNL